MKSKSINKRLIGSKFKVKFIHENIYIMEVLSRNNKNNTYQVKISHTNNKELNTINISYYALNRYWLKYKMEDL